MARSGSAYALPRDSDRVAAAGAVKSSDGVTVQPLEVDNSGNLLVNVAAGGTAGTQYAELTTTSPGTGTLSLGRYKASAPTLTDGQMYGLQLDSSGNLKITGSLSVGGTTDNSAYTAGTSTGTPSMGFYHSTIDAVTDGRAAAVAITANRAQHSNLRNASGTEIATTSNPLNDNIAQFGGTNVTIGQQLAAASIPVILPSATITALTPPSNTGYALDSSLSTIDTDLKSNITLHSGTNVIGKVSIDQTTPGTTNLVALAANQSINNAQVAGTATSVGNGTTDAGTTRVTLSSDSTGQVKLATGANTIGAVTSNPALASTIINNQQTVTTSSVALATNTLTQGITVEALSTNTVSVFIGASGVTTTTGLELAPGSAITLPVNNSNLVFVRCASGSPVVTWVAV